MSYASAARQSLHTAPTASETPATSDNARLDGSIYRRVPSATQVPRTDVSDEDVYVLTLLTSKAHHKRMTELRNKYFPKHLNKLAAHLTLFHALPGSRLDSDVIPVIRQVARTTAPFDITASQPFKLNRSGVAISILPQDGGDRAKRLRDELQTPWKQQGFLSQQDAAQTGRSFPHYTVMNKVKDEADVQKALDELKRDFKPDQACALGLILFRYEKGFWRFQRKFEFGEARTGDSRNVGQPLTSE